MNTMRNDQMGVHGIVERRLLSRERFFQNLEKLGVEFDLTWENYSLPSMYQKGLEVLSKDVVDYALDKSAKKQFKDNALWRLLRTQFNLDLAIPFVTGVYTDKAIKRNLITTVGKKIVADQLGGTTTTPVTAIAIGVGTTAAAAGDTALVSESTTSGAARGAATVTNTTTTTTGDTEQWVKTFSFTGTLAITEEGLLDSNTTGGKLLARQVFSAVNVVSGDSLQITHKVTVS